MVVASVRVISNIERPRGLKPAAREKALFARAIADVCVPRKTFTYRCRE